jgi:hypothetical protein
MEEPLEPRSDEVEVLAEFAKPRGKAPFHVCILYVVIGFSYPSTNVTASVLSYLYIFLQQKDCGHKNNFISLFIYFIYFLFRLCVQQWLKL